MAVGGWARRPRPRLEDSRRVEPDQSRPGGASRAGAVIGVISDTHGLLRPEVFEAFAGVDLILHAGDVGDPRILTDLAAIASVRAVWGNVDGTAVRDSTVEAGSGEAGGLRWGMAHGHQVMPRYERLLDLFPGAGLVVHGHTHEPALSRIGDVLLLNPGSAGPRRAGKPVTVALVVAAEGAPRVRHVDLETGAGFRLLRR